MRTSTKLATSLMSIGALAVAYKLGLPTASATALANDNSNSQTDNSQTTTQPTANPTPTPAPSQTQSSSSGSSKTPTPKKTTSSSGSNTGGGSTTTDPGTSGGTTAAAVTKQGAAFNYRYGTIQVSVTKTNGVISSVDMIIAGATGGRERAFATLQQAAVDANGTAFGNVSGATFTTDTFKQAVESALAKF